MIYGIFTNRAATSTRLRSREFPPLTAVVLGVALLGGLGGAALCGCESRPEPGSAAPASGGPGAARGASSSGANHERGAGPASGPESRAPASEPVAPASGHDRGSGANLEPSRLAIDPRPTGKPTEQAGPSARRSPPAPASSLSLPRGCDIARGWEPEDSRLSTCEGIADEDCRRIKRCLGIQDSNMGPGIKKN